MPLQLMRSYVQSSARRREAGGVLMGRHIADCDDVVVDQVTVPMRGDRRERYRFSRRQHRHQTVIERVWRESGGTCAYLGEWHTHPEPVPTPSAVDTGNWRRKMWEDRFSDFVFFVILGTREIRVWEAHERDTALFLLNDV
jgi:integrative and conjugative element protein (TIGR02256 family)